jgi:hypothetical protein
MKESLSRERGEEGGLHADVLCGAGYRDGLCGCNAGMVMAYPVRIRSVLCKNALTA